MATWKKLVVSGSAISQLNNDSNYLVSTSTGVDLGGAFSGSFQGDGSNLTGVTAAASNALVDGGGIIDFSYNGSAAGVTVAVDSGSLAGNGLTTSAGKFVVEAADSTINVGGSGINVVEANLSGIPNSALTNDGIMIGSTDISLGATGSSLTGLTNIVNSGQVADTKITGSFTGSFSGAFTGTSNLPDLTDGNGIADFTYDGSSAASIAVEVTGSTLSVGAGGVKVADAGITATQIATSVAGDGLAGGAGTALSVNVDDSSIEINSDTLRIKNSGVTNTMLATNGSFVLGTTSIALGTTASSAAGLTLTGATLTGASASGSFSGSFQGDGSSLTGIATTLSIQGDTGSDTVNLQTGTLDFEGTSNEIVTTVSDDKVTIALPDDVTIGRDLTVDRDLTVSRNLVVSGTASFQHTEDLDIKDRFIRMASGSTSAGDGGFVVQQTEATDGEVFGFDSATTRFGVSGSFDASQNTFTPDAFMAAVVEGSANDPDDAPARYDKKGNIFIANNEDIYIYS